MLFRSFVGLEEVKFWVFSSTRATAVQGFKSSSDLLQPVKVSDVQDNKLGKLLTVQSTGILKLKPCKLMYYQHFLHVQPNN